MVVTVSCSAVKLLRNGSTFPGHISRSTCCGLLLKLNVISVTAKIIKAVVYFYNFELFRFFNS